MPPWDLIQSALMETVLVPFAVSAAVAFIAWRLRLAAVGTVIAISLAVVVANERRDAIDFRIDSEQPFTVSQVVAAARMTLTLEPQFTPRPPARYWLPWAMLLAGSVGVLTQSPRMPKWLGIALQIAVAVMVTLLLSPADGLSWQAFAFAAVIVANWRLFDRLLRNPMGLPAPVAITFNIYLAGVVLLYAHSARLNDIAVMTGSAMLGVAIVAWRWKAEARGLAPFAAVLLPGIMSVGERTHSSDVPLTSFALVALSPLVLFLLPVFQLCGLHHRRWTWLGLALFLMPSIIAVISAARVESLAFD